MSYFPELPPEDLHPISSGHMKRARDADYARMLERRRIEHLADGEVSGPVGLRHVRKLAWTLGAAATGFLGAALPYAVLRSDAFLGLAILLAIGIVAGWIAVDRAGAWPLFGIVIGAASIAPVYLLLGFVPFLGDGWFIVAALDGLAAFIGYTIGGWLRATRAA